jgi:hypothetical protein
MTTKTITSLTDYLLYIDKFDQCHIAQWFYRGVKKEPYSLVPSLFRINIDKIFSDWAGLEQYMLKIFKRESAPFLTIKPNTDIEWMTLAQHFRLPTRLLDWTTNPLIALYFAVENYKDKVDSAIWCFGFYSTNNCFQSSTRVARRITLEKEDLILFPNHISARITNQSGCFTLHDLPNGNNPFIPFENQTGLSGFFEKIIIKKPHQKLILDQLYNMGIHSEFVYPGLDGLSDRIKYEVLTYHDRHSNPEQVKRMFNLD